MDTCRTPNEPEVINHDTCLPWPTLPELDFPLLLHVYLAMTPDQRAQLKRHEGVPDADDEDDEVNEPEVKLDEDNPRRYIYDELAARREDEKGVADLLAIAQARVKRYEELITSNSSRIGIYKIAFSILLHRHRLLQMILLNNKLECNNKVEYLEQVRAMRQELEDAMRPNGYEV